MNCCSARVDECIECVDDRKVTRDYIYREVKEGDPKERSEKYATCYMSTGE